MEGNPNSNSPYQSWMSDNQVAAPTLQQNSGIQPIEWTASEFIAHQKSSGWFIGLGAIAAVMTLLVFVVTRSWTSMFVIVIVFVVTGVYAVRQPATKKYRITEDGVYVDARHFSFGSFKSFSVMNEGAVDCVWLRPLRKYMPTVAMYYPPDDEQRIVMTLQNFLPQEDRVHDVFDKVARKIRF